MWCDKYSIADINAFAEQYPDDDNLQYSWEVQMECDTFDWYYAAAVYAKAHGKSCMVDIGCANGLQASVVMQAGLEYVGIDTGGFPETHQFDRPVNGRMPTYQNAIYPHTPIVIPENSIAVSHLCIGWPCYFWTGQEQHDVFKQLASDFDTAILYIPPEILGICNEYFVTEHPNDLCLGDMYETDMTWVLTCKRKYSNRLADQMVAGGNHSR